MGLIYKYTNKINGKAYIGQTTQSLEKRHKRHLADSQVDDLYFHRALKKYGIENFTLEILEDNIEKEYLDEREKYWIKYWNTFYLNKKGYNMTEGGQWGNAPRKLSDLAIQEIQNLLIKGDYSLKDIAQEYNVSLSCISDINTGRTWKKNEYVYPLHPKSIKNTILSLEELDRTIQLLLNTKLNYSEIAKTMEVPEYTVGSINRGEHSLCKKTSYNFPIRKPVQKGTYQNKITEKQVLEIIFDLIYSNLTNKELGKKYGVHYNTIGFISQGKIWKDITSCFILPIKKNKEINKSCYKNFMV